MLPEKEFQMSNSKTSPFVVKGKFVDCPDLVLNLDFYDGSRGGGLGFRARGQDGEILKRFWQLGTAEQEKLATEIWRFAVSRVRQGGRQG